MFLDVRPNWARKLTFFWGGAILAANARDMETARANDRPAAFLDRLMLNEARLGDIAAAVRQIAAQNDPLGEVIEAWEAPSGVNISQVRVPIGVLGVIFEARPNVTADAAALAIRSGNAVLLRSGSDSLQSALALVSAIRRGLEAAGFPADLIQHPDTADRAFVGAMLSGLEGQLDLVVLEANEPDDPLHFQSPIGRLHVLII